MKLPAITFLLTLCLAWSTARAQEVIDSVVASVDGEPITLLELCNYLRPPRRLTLQEAAASKEARQALDSIIRDRLIAIEAATRRVSISDEEVQAVVERVASRNNLTRGEFEEALRNENNTIENFKVQIKNELLRQKLAASLAAGGVNISDQEADEYIKDHPQLFGGGGEVELQQIFVSTGIRSAEQAAELINKALEQIKQSGDFAAAARKFSESPEASEGGSLGSLAESELNPLIFNSILHLKQGDLSAITQSSAGLHVFKVVRREQAGKLNLDEHREEAREALRREKLEDLLKGYFGPNLYKQHAVDMKW
ncbi:MAG: hypothetical protein GX589_04975 [Deltaproteobacteria bacterium]|nr:hypothetical protein [Deltaproteobacteria bacterium]